MHRRLICTTLLLAGCSAGPPAPPTYVGEAACARCHQSQAREWTGSHHQQAMQEASEQTVLGNFQAASLSYNGVTSRFFRKGPQFWVNTDGPDGQLTDYQVKYTFGVSPLQQYLVELPGGRLQALSLAWDCKGQRWFHLYPGEKVDHRDILHWTGLYQNWNQMCSDCHSTNLSRGYDGQGYHTTWSELNVSCEACHGPGSQHVARPETPWPHPLSNPGKWIPQSGATASRSQPSAAAAQIQVCAHCHSRRSQLENHPAATYLDGFAPSLLEAPNYYPDGQNQDEVYEYGAFLQSKMAARGVACSDCHNPHSLELKAPGAQVCLACHAADRYAPSEHSHHSSQTSCIDCHMPTRTYMVVHTRHDHSFRVPRPDLSVALGVPNTCTHCHKDRSDAWAAQAVKAWFGPRRVGFQTYGPAFQAARAQAPGAPGALMAVVDDASTPPLARATALAELSRFLSERSLPTLQKGVSDPDPLVRLGAARALEGLPIPQRWELGDKLLSDPLGSVRMEAARWLGSVPQDQLTAAQRQRLAAPMQEFLHSCQFDPLPEESLVLAAFYSDRGEAAQAEAAYKSALQREPRLMRTYINLADFYRSQNQDPKAEQLLRQALEDHPQEAALHHALGLLLVRRQAGPQALDQLAQAARLEPDNPRYAYVYAVALESGPHSPQALAVLQANLKTHPNHLESLLEAVRLLGRSPRASAYWKRLRELAQGDPRVARLLQPR